LGGLVAVDVDHLLRGVDLQVAVDEDEQPGGGGVSEKLLRLGVKRGDGLG
jgi:hypothetical protein